ncbi:MAG: hypothetical protein K8S24_08390 [Candidatus Aegiribacteria sp.]|nr:hypothetical protein [Candidatus Aegiribacteria sp.]
MNEELRKIHHNLAIECFNSTWNLLDRKDRTRDDDLKMIHCAHCSRFHWGEIGTPLEFQRGEWQTSRVYSVLNLGESALYHAQYCHDLCVENGINDFDMAFACEAMARAYHVLGNTEERDRFIELGKSASQSIEDPENKDYFLGELNSIIS